MKHMKMMLDIKLTFELALPKHESDSHCKL